MKEQTLLRKNALFVEALIILQKIFKRIRQEKEKALLMVIEIIDKRNRYLGNVLDVDLKIT